MTITEVEDIRIEIVWCGVGVRMQKKEQLTNVYQMIMLGTEEAVPCLIFTVTLVKFK